MQAARWVHRVNTEARLTARKIMTPTKNDRTAISTHPNGAQCNDKPFISSMLSVLVETNGVMTGAG